MGKIQDLTGMTFGKLTVIREVGRIHGGVLWECRCECGKLKNARACSLKNGDVKTCGTRKQCHHAWQGGHRNVGSIAWASKRLAAMRMEAIGRNHAAPNSTPEQLLEMIKNAGNQCQICKKRFASPSAMCIDHCHNTGEIRGMLCNSCNAGIGMFNDSAELLSSAIEYLAKQNGEVVTA